MINRGTIDRLDDAVDEFEERWSPDSPSRIEDLLSQHGLRNDADAIVELIRVDIELRNQRGLPIEIDDYIDRFGVLRDHPDRIAELAFEDFRSRSASGQCISANRWKEFPSVREERWYQDLVDGQTRIPSRPSRVLEYSDDPEYDAVFEQELNDCGFHLVHEIGAGAFSRVFLANQSNLANRFVVLKIVTQTLAEPEFMALLQHTNIVPIYSFHRISSRSVICMPYTGYVTLRDFLKAREKVADRSGETLVSTVRDRIEDTKRRFEFADEQLLGELPDLMIPAADVHGSIQTLDRFRSYDCDSLALWIFERLANALSHAHARGVVHNDLKPSNILIRNDGEPALLDFNLSESLCHTSARHAGGTLPYMSPEAYRGLMGKPIRPQAESDVYSLGVILFEFVTGRFPFPVPPSTAPVDLSAALDARRRQPDWSTDDHVASGLKSIINRCLQFDLPDRYAAAEELRHDLEREQNHLSLVYCPEPLTSKLRKWQWRHPRLISASLVACLLLLVLIPLAYRTFVSEARINALAAERNYEEFQTQSNACLSALMVDPNREQQSKIDQGVEILDSFDLFSDQGISSMLAVGQSHQADGPRETIRRHITHLAILEAGRLWQQRVSDPDASRDVSRLDKLIAAIRKLQGDQSTRSLLFLQADRARLVGETEDYKTLFAEATATVIDGDSDVYLEAARLLSNSNYLRASELLESLADRGSIPAAIRWTMLGRAQFHNGDVRDALLSFTQSIERAPNSAVLRTLRGRCHYELGHRDAALRDYQKAIELDPDARGAWSQMGMVYLSKGILNEALACFNRVLEISPGRIFALLKRSKIYQAQGKHDLAQADYQAALNVPCEDDVELTYRAFARADDDPEAALEDLRQASRLAPDQMILLRQMANILSVKLNHYEQAIELYTACIEKKPTDEYALTGRALAYIRTDRIRDGLSDIRRAMKDGAGSARTHYQAACLHALVYQKSGRSANRDRALVLLADAIRKGYPADNLGEDSDLDSIRDTEEFTMVAEMVNLSSLPKKKTTTSKPITP